MQSDTPAPQVSTDSIKAQSSRLFRATPDAPEEKTLTHLAVTADTLPADDVPKKPKAKPAPKVSRGGALPEPPPMPAPPPLGRAFSSAASTPPAAPRTPTPSDPPPSLSLGKIDDKDDAKVDAKVAPAIAPLSPPADEETRGGLGRALARLGSLRRPRSEKETSVEKDKADTKVSAAAPTVTTTSDAPTTPATDALSADETEKTEAPAEAPALTTASLTPPTPTPARSPVSPPASSPASAPIPTPASTPAPKSSGLTAKPLVDDAPDSAVLAESGALTEEEALTVFGARKPRGESGTRGKPRFMGLILTAVLILALVLIGLWASFLPDTDAPQTSALSPEETLPTEEQAPETVAQTPTTIIDTTPDESELAHEPEADFAETLPAEPLLDEDPDAPAPQLAETELPPPLAPEAALPDAEEVAAHFETTGVWIAPPDAGNAAAPAEDTTEALYIASIDPQISSKDATALPDVARLQSDPMTLDGLLPPAPAGTTYDFDERGLVRATPEGALTPSGAVVFAGRPDVVPGPRPVEAAAAAQAAIDSDPEGPAATRAAEEDAIRESLEGFVPRLRPEALIENNERANLGGLTLAQLAAFRPTLRPASLQQEAQEAAEAAGQDAPAATAPRVEASPIPSARPQDFAKLAAAARAAQQAAAQAAEANTTTNSAAAGVTANVPQSPLPSGAPVTVARAATETNQINLRRLNLIGVFGSSSDRRALLRLPSGRFSKVKVGDSIDGGRVQAISADALTYVKNGRSITLQVGGG